MSALLAQVLASTVVAALVSSAAILAREMILVRSGRRSALAQARRDGAQQRLAEHEMLVREIDSLWRHNARLRRREAECQRRCRTLEQRLRSVERTCGQLRRRLEGLARVVASESANLQRGNARDRQPA